MAITVNTISSSGTSTYNVKVEISSYDTISNPVTYVSTEIVYREILSKAGLDSNLYYIGAELTSTASVGILKIYYLIVQYSSKDGINAGVGHTHTSNSLTFPLQAAYNDGSIITVTSSDGPIVINCTEDINTDYFKISTDTNTTDRILFAVERQSVGIIGINVKYTVDSTYDIGSVDGGVTKMRPRDVYIGRNINADGEGSFATLALTSTVESAAFGIGSIIGPTDESWTLHKMVKVNINGADTWICTYNYV